MAKAKTILHCDNHFKVEFIFGCFFLFSFRASSFPEFLKEVLLIRQGSLLETDCWRFGENYYCLINIISVIDMDLKFTDVTQQRQIQVMLQ